MLATFFYLDSQLSESAPPGLPFLCGALETLTAIKSESHHLLPTSQQLLSFITDVQGLETQVSYFSHIK